MEPGPASPLLRSGSQAYGLTADRSTSGLAPGRSARGLTAASTVWGFATTRIPWGPDLTIASEAFTDELGVAFTDEGGTPFWRTR